MTAPFSSYWRELANGTRTEPRDRLLILLLAPLALAYGFIQSLRALLYRIGILKSFRLPRPVISIGNITVGGTGKTPVTAHIARLLLDQGYRVAVLSRGYGGSLEGQTVVVSDGATVMLSSRECGDEPFLLASTIPGLMVVIGSDRYAAGLLAMQQLDPDVFLLDDGFQHLRLRRDLNILLLDQRNPFGNGWCLPVGLLREPIRASQRADLIIHTRSSLDAEHRPIVAGKPFCSARHQLSVAIPLTGGAALPLAQLQNKRGFAFAGIAEPQAFFDELRVHGLNLAAVMTLPDHVSYDSSHIRAVENEFNSSGADYAITTEKDGVKLKNLPQDLSEKTLLAPLTLTIADSTPMKALLRNLLQK